MDMIEQLLGEFAPLIDKAIRKYIPRKLDDKMMNTICLAPRYTYDTMSATKVLHEPIWDLLDRGGKRWRPALMLIVAEAFGGTREALIDYAVIPEIIHNGTLMVDDIEDDSDIRRNKACIHKMYGNDVAINAGNAMYYLPLYILRVNPAGLDDDLIRRAYEIYVQEMINISYGQGLDIYMHKGLKSDVSEGEYLQMCAFKTGTLARMSAKLGALFAGANPEQIESAGAFAEALGVGFQIQDDILNLFPNAMNAKWGKECGDDITEGKRTLLVIRALEKLSDDKKKRLLEILDMHTRDDVLRKEAISIIGGTDAVDFSKCRSREIVESAWADCESKMPDGKPKILLKEFANYMISRSS